MEGNILFCFVRNFIWNGIVVKQKRYNEQQENAP